MTSEHRPRQHPIMNPEAAAAVLRQLVAGWDTDDQDAFVRALAEARRLLGRLSMTEPAIHAAIGLEAILTANVAEARPETLSAPTDRQE